MLLRITNHLRSHRKRSSLSQSEVAFLLGSKDGGQISRYEKGHRVPTLRTAIAFTMIFGVSLSILFSGIQIGVDTEVGSRIKQLRATLGKKPEEHRETAGNARKLRWLDERPSRLRKHSDSAT
jgi:transcriptional regulator with XRE-family HTH domain